jgi:hypothetical protein
MPYASSIQFVTDANGTAHAFLEDDGFLWQCQWNSEAQRWDKGQVVPMAYGGEQLQALLVEDLFPTSGTTGDQRGNTPGIVLAYRVGKGSEAQIYGSFGQWGSDGQLQWSAPLALTASAFAKDDFSLLATGQGTFDLVVQQREPGANITTLLQDLQRTPSEDLQQRLEEALSDARRDSDLSVSTFQIATAGQDPSGGAGNQLQINLAPSTAAGNWQNAGTLSPAQPLQPATALPLATGGNTQLDRAQLQQNGPGAGGTTLLPAAAANPAGGLTEQGNRPFNPAQVNPWVTTYSTGKFGGLVGMQMADFEWVFLEGGQGTPGRPNQQKTLAENRPVLDPSGNPRTDASGIEIYQWVEVADQVFQDFGNPPPNWILNPFIFTNTGKGRKHTGVWKGIYGGYSATQSATSYVRAKIGYARKASWDGIGYTRPGQIEIENNRMLERRLVLQGNRELIEESRAKQAGGDATTYYYLGKNTNGRTRVNRLQAKYSVGIGYEQSKKFIEGQANLASWSDFVNYGISTLQVGNIDSSQPTKLLTGGALLPMGVAAAINTLGGFLSIFYRNSQAPLAARNEYGAGGNQDRAQTPRWLAQTNTAAGVVISGISGLVLPIVGLTKFVDEVGTGTIGGAINGGIEWSWLKKGLIGVYAQGSAELTLARNYKAKEFYSDFWLNIIAGVALPFGNKIPIFEEYWYPAPSLSAGSAARLGASTSAPDGSAYPFSYAPASGSLQFSSMDPSGSTPLVAGALPLVGGNTTPLQRYSLASSSAANPSLNLLQAGQGLVDGSYTNVPILALSLPGSAPASLSFSVSGGQVVASSITITVPAGGGSYIALPETQAGSGIYVLSPDVFSTGILPNPGSSASAGALELLPRLPLITVDASRSGAPLSITPISAVAPAIPLTGSTDPSSGSYPERDPATGLWALPAAGDNSLYTYFNVPVTLTATAAGPTPAPLNPGVTATVTLSGGRILAVSLDQPFYLNQASGAAYSLSLNLQGYLAANGYSGSLTNPSYTVSAQTLVLNNLVEDEAFAANPAASGTSAAAAVWLAAGINDELAAFPVQAGWPVQNRVSVVDAAGAITYLNATATNGAPTTLARGNDSLAQLSANPVSFSAASTPTAITLAGAPGQRFSGASLVFWVEASDPVIPQISSDGTQNYQAFMQALYGAQRINYRINPLSGSGSQQGWETPRVDDLYTPDNAVIRQLQAFEVNTDGQPRTLLVWDETPITAIKDLPTISLNGWIDGTTLSVSSLSGSLRVGDLISGGGVAEGTVITAIHGDGTYSVSRSQSLGSADIPISLQARDLRPATVLKAGFINPNANSLQWNDLFKDAAGQSTIQTLPWDANATPGLGIESIIAATQLQRAADGSVVETPVLSWDQAVRTPYRESVLESQPFIYLDLGALAPGVNSVNLGGASPDTTTTTASDSGLNFAIRGALPKSTASAVQNTDGTGVLATGTGSLYGPLTSLFSNATPEQLAADGPGQLQGSLSGTTLTVTSLTAGTLRVGDVLSGSGLLPGTVITGIGTVDAAGLGTYTVSQAQTLASTSLLALPVPAGVPYASFSGSISGTTLTLSNLNGALQVGDQVLGEGISGFTTITAIGAVDASGNGTYSVSLEQTAGSSSAPLALVATPSSSAPYTVEFWTQLGTNTNPNGAGLVAFGQPSAGAVGEAKAPEGWLLVNSFVVEPYTVQEALERSWITALPSGSDPGDLYGWGWAVVADGANTTAMDGNGGSNLYSNALQLSNLVSGQSLAGIAPFLANYGLTPADLGGGIDGILADTIAAAPVTELQFNHALDAATGLPVSNLNTVAIDTSSAELNKGVLLAADLAGSAKAQQLTAMFEQLWAYQQQTGEAKVNFSLAPDSTASTTSPSALVSEQYVGYELGFSLFSGVAVSVDGQGRLVFDVAPGLSLTASATGGVPADLRDGQWHYVSASFLPDYRSYVINGETLQLPSNVGTASLVIDNQLVATASGVLNPFPLLNLNDNALLLANNAGGAIDQVAFYNQALTLAPLPSNGDGLWPQLSAAEARQLMQEFGIGADPNTTPGTQPGGLTEHWLARNVNPDDAILATRSTTFLPSSTNPLQGTWTEAAPLNVVPASQATPTSASAGSLQNDLLIQITPGDWTAPEADKSPNSNWLVAGGTGASGFNPAGEQLQTIKVTLTPSGSGNPITRSLSPEQVLIGGNTIASLQPRASTTDLHTTLLSAAPALNLRIARQDDDPSDPANTGDLDLQTTYSASVALHFADGTADGKTVTNNPAALPLSLNSAGSSLITDYSTDTSNNTLTNRSKALATADVIEAAPLQLKYIDSGVVLNSASSTAAAGSPAAPSPARSFGQSQVIGSFAESSTTSNGTTTTTVNEGWIAIAQPFSTNAISNPAGRVWIQYTGEYKTVTDNNGNTTSTTPSADAAKAPSTWLNALARSNFSPETPNRPLLNDAFNPSAFGGLLIQADATAGWGQNFGQTMLVADVNGDQTPDLIISAPQANGGGRVVIIDGAWIKANLTNSGGQTVLNLANPGSLGPHVTILTGGAASGDDAASTDSANFGAAVAFAEGLNGATGTIWIGAPNYQKEAPDGSLVPVGAVYSYNAASNSGWGTGVATALTNPALGILGSTASPDPTGTARKAYWGAELGTAIAVDGSGKIAVSAPGVQASLLYSGTEAVQEAANGEKNPSDPYGMGALVKIELPTKFGGFNVSSTAGTENSLLQDIVNQDINAKSDLAAEESTYMQNLKALQTDNIADATQLNNQAIQTGAVGAVFLFNNASDLSELASKSSIVSAENVFSQGGSTFYGPQPWNTLQQSGFGSSLAFADLNNSNQAGLVIGAAATGGPGAVYALDPQWSFSNPSSETWLTKTNLGSNQYLAHLTSSLTLYGADSYDQFGNGLVNLGDTNKDGHDDLLIQAFNANGGAGSGTVLFGSDQLFKSTTAETTKNTSITIPNAATGSVAPGSIGTFKRADGSSFTSAILSELGAGSGATGQGTFGAGDVNGDGRNDIPLGAGNNGQAYLTYGKDYLEAISNLQLQKLASNTGYLLEGLATTTQGSLRSVGDFNGDGYGDFVSIQPGTFLDTVRIELGANTEEILADYPFNFYSFQVAPGTQVLNAGDSNGDGFTDIALFLQQNLSSAADGNAGAGSTTGILYGRPSDQLPLGSGFGLLAPTDAAGNPLAPLPTGPISGALSTRAPAMLAVGNTVYAVWCDALAGSTNLWFAQSRDGGTSWSSDTNLTSALPNLASTSTPSLTLFNDKLYLAFLNGSNQLALSSWDPASADATRWSDPTVLSEGTSNPTSTLTPALIANGDALSVVWVDGTSKLQGSTTTTPDLAVSNGAGPAFDWAQVAGASSPNTPALASNGSTVYMARRGSDNRLYWTSSSDGGQSWGSWQPLPSGMTTNDAPSLAVVNGSLYLTYLGAGNQELNITQLTNAATNSWSAQTVVSNQSARNGLGAVAINETVGSTEGLAIYYVANNSTGTILRTWSSTPLTASTWSASQQLNGQTASGPLAVTRFNSQSYLAYQGGTPGTPSNVAFITTASTPSSSGSWSVIASRNAGNHNGIGLSSDAIGLLLNTTDSGTGQQAIVRLTPPSGSGSWSQSFYTSRASISGNAPTAAIQSLPGSGNPPQLLLAAADPANGGAVDTSVLAPQSSWTAATTLLERLVATDGTVSFQPISATAAPSVTLLNGAPVLAANNNGTLSVLVGNATRTFSLASSFSPGSTNQAGSTAAGLTTTDTGLALSYRNGDGSVSLERLALLNLDGTPVDGVQINADGSLVLGTELQWQGINLAAGSGLSTALATVPLSVNGTLLLGSTSSGSTNQVQLNAMPVLSDPESTAWLNSTVQLPDGQGGWMLQQKAGANGAINLGPVLPDWQPIDNFNTPDAPAFVELSGVLYAITRGENQRLYINSSSDAGITWSGWSSNPNTTDSSGKSVSTTQPPTITSFGGQLYVCYIRSSDSNLMLTRYEPGTKAWGEAINIGSQTAKYLAAINQDDNLFTLFYVGSDDKIYYTSTTDPGNKGSFTGSAAINNSSGNVHQTASGPLAAVRLNGATYLAYQGGTSSSPSNTIYITTGPVANNNNGQNWGTFIPPGPQTSSTSKSIGLSANNLGLVLSTTDTINGQQVISLQQGTGSGTNWSFTPFTTLQQKQTSSVSRTSATLVGSRNKESVLVASTAGSNTAGTNALISAQASYQPLTLTLTSQQTGSSLSSVGDLDGDGLDDLMVVANNVVVQPDQASQQLATGLRLIRGAATGTSLLNINANESTSSSQSVQIASSFGLNGNTPVLSLSGSQAQLSLTSTSTTTGQPSELRAALLSPSLFEASSGDLNTARRLFSGSPTTGAQGLGLGFGNLSLNTTGSFGDLNADGYLDTLDGMPTTVYGANGLGWQVWSIRAAGDVNGNGADDVLLSLVPPEAVLNGAPQLIQPVLVDGALFEVNKETNSFSLEAMRVPLNPFGRLQLQDQNATTATQPWPLLQNWLTPILSFTPGPGSSSATISTLSPASTSLPGLSGGAAQQATVATAYGSSGEILLISGSMTANGFDQTGFPIIQISRVSADGTSTQWTAGIPGGVLSKANTGSSSDPHYFQLSPSGAAFFKGYLYLALSSAPYLVSVSGEILTEDDGEMFLFSIKESDLTPDGVSDASKWNQYQLPGKTSLQPALVNEGDRLGLYYVSDNDKQNILYSYSADPQLATGNWQNAGGTGDGLIYSDLNGNNTPIQLSNTGQTQNIAATRFQDATYIAFSGKFSNPPGVYVAKQPDNYDPSSNSVWTTSREISNTQPGLIFLSANDSQLCLTTTNLTGENSPFGVTLYNTIDSTPATATLRAGANATVVGASTIGGQLALQTQSTQFFGSSIALQPVATPWASASQQSLAGYSIDGNIDVNGDGFMDMLVSDPSDPSKNVDNQYALFGGDYLNIASQVGTPGDDVMLGTPLADVIYAIQGADQVTSNGGADVILTGAGDDAISIEDNAFIRIDAGSGFDQLLLEGLANQSYDFRLNIPSPQYFAGTKLRDIELISSRDYGANALSFDAAAINAINPDRVLFVVPDAADTIDLTPEFSRNTNFDTSFGGTLWNAYAAAPASATPASSNPALLYVATPTGQSADWLTSHVSTSLTAPAASLRAATAAAPADPLGSLPTTNPIAGRQTFGDGLTLLAYRSDPASGVARFAIERGDSRRRQVIAYASSSANSAAEPGRHYTPACGLLVLEPGQNRQEIAVPLDRDAFARLRRGSLSLAVEELADRGHKPLHLLLEPQTPASGGSAPPALSGFTLLPDSSGEGATLRFRADSNASTSALESLRLSISRRRSADSSTVETSQILDILDARPGNGQTPAAYNAVPGALALDNDQRANSQIGTQLELSFTAAAGEPSVRLAAPALQWQSPLQLDSERTLQFSQDTPFTLWRADNGTTPVTFGLQGGSQSLILLRDATGGSSGSINPQNALSGDPLTGWLASEGLAVGSRTVVNGLPLAGITWTPTATSNGQPLALLDLSQDGNQITARFSGGITAVFGLQGTGQAPSPTPIRPAVEVQRLAGYDNALAFYALDSITGMVDGINPGESGYLQKALARSEASGLLLAAGDLPPYGASRQYTDLPLDPNRSYGALLLVDGDRSRLYSSFAAANPGGVAQMINLGSSRTGLVLGFEDLPATRGDADYNDLVVNITNVSVPLF